MVHFLTCSLWKCNQKEELFFVAEGLFIFLSLLVTTGLLSGITLYSDGFTLLVLKTALVSVIFQLCLYYFDLYDLRQSISGIDTFTRMSQAFGVGCIILGAIYYLTPGLIFFVLFRTVKTVFFGKGAS